MIYCTDKTYHYQLLLFLSTFFKFVTSSRWSLWPLFLFKNVFCVLSSLYFVQREWSEGTCSFLPSYYTKLNSLLVLDTKKRIKWIM